LSIKPEYAERIFDGSKRFEFRRSIFTRDDIEEVVVYASAPISMVVGQFTIGSIIAESPSKLWRRTKPYTGISRKLFLQYFKGKAIGYAIEVKSYERYDEPLSLSDTFGIAPPQSFAYVTAGRLPAV